MAEDKAHIDTNSVTTVVAIPGYKIIDILGRGGMAIVYKAIQESVGRTVAIKILAPNHADETFTDRFLREAQIISNLTHPNIITVFDAGVIKSHHYMSMEYISGKTLRDARDDLSRKQKIDILKQIAKALDYAGKKGYVHRDIKPENIMLHEDGRAVLMDFGIARGDDTVNSLTLTGKAIGTPYYMSPEQTKGLKVDPRSDIYSLGVVLFQALTGYVPYDGTSFVEVGIKHISEPIPSLPRGLESFQIIINKSMSKDPEHRYQTASELIDDLNKVSVSELECIDAKSAVINKKPADYNATTMVEAKVKKLTPGLTKSKSRLKGNIKSGKKIKSKSSYSGDLNVPGIDVRNTDEFKILKRRRRLIYFVLVLIISSAGYLNKKTIKPFIEPYWNEYALPILHEYLPTELKEKIGLNDIKPQPEDKLKKSELVKKQKEIEALKQQAMLFSVENIISTNNKLTLNDDSVKIVSKKDASELYKQLDNQPENAQQLIVYYKYLLSQNIHNKEARQGIIKLRHWFLSQLKHSVKNNDVIRGNLVLNLLKTNFPQVIDKPKYQKFETILLRKESITTHLKLAEEFFNKKHYIEPLSENSLEELEAVFAIDSENATAKSLQRKILDIFVEQVKNKQAAKQYESALISARSGLKVSKNDAFLKSSYKNLQSLFKKQQQVDSLLNLASIQMTQGNFVTPENNNAFTVYNSIFEIEVNNKGALSGIKEIELKLVNQAKQAIKSNDFSTARKKLQLIEQYYPDSKQLKKTQTKLAEAIDSKHPTVTKIVFSDVLMSSMGKMEDIRIQSGKKIYFGFTFKNFSKESNYLLVRLLDHTAVTRILDKTIVIDGTSGEQIFSIEIPGKGLVKGNYYIELKHGKKSLIKKSFQIFEP